MIVVGLTGSIGMGKSTAARLLRVLGVPVHDADETVHRLLGKGGAAVPEVARAFPGVLSGGKVDRRRLGARVFDDAGALERLEAILHPAVRRSARAFLRHAARRRVPLVVLDIPLLFETGSEALCDAVVVVSAPAFLQNIRVLSRPGMTPQRFRFILAKQLSDEAKRRRADYIVRTGLSKRDALRRLDAIVKLLRSGPRERRRTRVWPLTSWARRRARRKDHA